MSRNTNPTKEHSVRIRSAIMAGTVGLGGLAALIGVAGPASAHVPTVSAECGVIHTGFTSYETIEGNPTPNMVEVFVDGVSKGSVDFGASYSHDWSMSKTAVHNWKVVVDAVGTQFDHVWTGTVQPCEMPPTTTTTTVPPTTTTTAPPPVVTTAPVAHNLSAKVVSDECVASSDAHLHKVVYSVTGDVPGWTGHVHPMAATVQGLTEIVTASSSATFTAPSLLVAPSVSSLTIGVSEIVWPGGGTPEAWSTELSLPNGNGLCEATTVTTAPPTSTPGTSPVSTPAPRAAVSVAPSLTGPTGSLPATGSNAPVVVVAGLGALLVGGFLLLAGRRGAAS
jgi:LPXTG-motif cell wall-anchored protein